MESALITSMGKCEAKSTASFDLPEPVGPVMTTTFGCFGWVGFTVAVFSVAIVCSVWRKINFELSDHLYTRLLTRAIARVLPSRS